MKDGPLHSGEKKGGNKRSQEGFLRRSQNWKQRKGGRFSSSLLQLRGGGIKGTRGGELAGLKRRWCVPGPCVLRKARLIRGGGSPSLRRTGIDVGSAP